MDRARGLPPIEGMRSGGESGSSLRWAGGCAVVNTSNFSCKHGLYVDLNGV